MNFMVQAAAALAAAIVLAAFGGDGALPAAYAAVLPAPDGGEPSAGRNADVRRCVDRSAHSCCESPPVPHRSMAACARKPGHIPRYGVAPPRA